jgi:aminopeptidase N
LYLAAGEAWQVHSRETGGVTLRVYAPDNLAAGALAALGYAERALEEFGARYAPYPYAEMEIVATPTLALGIEYPGVVAIADRILTPEDTRLEATVVHEIAHQWFYNLVGNDQLDHPWLDEALAQFATLQYFEHRPGGAEAFRGYLESRWERVDLAEIPVGLPVASYGAQEYGAIVYGRGPLFFEALRNEIGTTAFDQFIRQYVSAYAWGIATPEGLQETAEYSCECELEALFGAWIE